MTYSLHVALVVEDCDLHLGLLTLNHVVWKVQGDKERLEDTKLAKVTKIFKKMPDTSTLIGECSTL